MIIGLTGGIATGKSEFSHYLSQLGWEIIDADEIARKLTGDSLIQKKLKDAFGPEVISSNGNLNRRYLARIVFFDAEKREKLNEIFFPAISKKIEEILSEKDKDKVVLLVAPLLYEAGLDTLVDLVVWIEAPLEIKIERLEKLGFSFNEAISRIRAGTRRSLYQKPGDQVIFNDGRRETLKEKANLFFKEITEELLEKESLGHA